MSNIIKKKKLLQDIVDVKFSYAFLYQDFFYAMILCYDLQNDSLIRVYSRIARC